MSPNIAIACCRGNSNWRRCGAVMKVRCCFGCCCFPHGACCLRHYRQQTDPLFPLTLTVLSLILAALLLFVVGWSDPFVRIFPPAIEGRDLNPMLQHPGLIFHPPLLYLGYGGLMVAASVALASLLRGEFDGTCARICWRWALRLERINRRDHSRFWWAYCELGWGGWWFWDPVENASLLPRLSSTALLHSLSLTRQRGFSATGRCCWR